MRAFAALYDAIDSTTSTNLKVAAIRAYLAQAAPADAAWAVYFLSGRKLKRLVGAAVLRGWLGAASALPGWLIEETYSQVGDLAETIALLVAAREGAAGDTRDVDPAGWSLSAWIEQRLLPLKSMGAEQQQAQVTAWWRELPYLECLVLNKLLTGSFRVGVSQTLLTRALAQHLSIEPALAAHRLMGTWEPGERFWTSLASPISAGDDLSRPYPFFLAAPLDLPPEELGGIEHWQAEWKWDGIRAQLIRRGGRSFLWSRGEELLTERFPDVIGQAEHLPDGTVLDGEILAWDRTGVLPFAVLQTRIARKQLSPALMTRAPVKFLPYDLLETQGVDIRAQPLRERRAQLDALLAAHAPGFIAMAPLEATSWDVLRSLRGEARARGVEGLMLKARASRYGVGRQRGGVHGGTEGTAGGSAGATAEVSAGGSGKTGWWKWKIDPYSIDAVMIYAQPGHGRRASLYTDYTFAVWSGGVLVPVAKAYSGLSNEEISVLDRWIRQHTLERFGPVRSVEPKQVFELAFEGIAASSRHKAGVALRFPRIARWRLDKPASEADTLDALQRLL